MRVLIACEFSGIVRDEFKKGGHYALSCDLLPSEKPGNHYQGNVLDIIDDSWDMMIAFPPCTYLCNSGVRWLHSDPFRWDYMYQACEFFNTLLSANIPKIAIENPVPHKYAKEYLIRSYDQIIQPYQHGHGETKKTCLWLKGLPGLEPSNVVSGRLARVHNVAPGKDRWKIRARTLPGIALAMFEQWSTV